MSQFIIFLKYFIFRKNQKKLLKSGYILLLQVQGFPNGGKEWGESEILLGEIFFARPWEPEEE